jgi:hypothetical protein
MTDDGEASVENASRMSISEECASCVHFSRNCPACRAFPNGIPEDILSGRVSHEDEYDGDGGYRYTRDLT